MSAQTETKAKLPAGKAFIPVEMESSDSIPHLRTALIECGVMRRTNGGGREVDGGEAVVDTRCDALLATRHAKRPYRSKALRIESST